MPDHFARLGLPRRFAVDAAALERAYLAHSRAVHPDYHAAGAGGELSASVELASAVNEAYQTLKEPFARADYLLGLLGGPTAQQEKAVDPAFLAEMMEYRERVEDAADRPAVRAEIGERIAATEREIAAAFDRPAAGAHDLAEVRKLLNAWKTLRSLLRGIPDD